LPKVKPQMALSKLKEYLDEIDRLLKLKYSKEKIENPS
jgi:hypothetical protein